MAPDPHSFKPAPPVSPCGFPERRKVPELWFEDGGVIIQADASLYRVSRGVLAAQSGVFKHMFDTCRLSGSVKEEEKTAMDGVPVLQLQDSETDVTHFLKAIFDSGYFEPYPSETAFSAIVGVLRLSHKYDVPHLRKRALIQLSHAYPGSLHAVDMRTFGPGYVRSPEELLEAFTVIQLALEVNADWLIPPAVYICCTYPIDAILSLVDVRSSNWVSSAAALKLCLSTWPKIRSCYHSLYDHLRTTSCLGWPTCLSHLTNKTKSYSNIAANWETTNDPLFSLDEKYWTNLKRDLCERCYDESRAVYRLWRKSLWDRLPGMIGLDDWDELIKKGRYFDVDTSENPDASPRYLGQ